MIHFQQAWQCPEMYPTSVAVCKINMYCIFKLQHMFECDISSIFHRIQYIQLVTTASSCDITAINVLMNSLVLVCKWSIEASEVRLAVVLPTQRYTVILILWTTCVRIWYYIPATCGVVYVNILYYVTHDRYCRACDYKMA